jgi:hypothetical protein
MRYYRKNEEEFLVNGQSHLRVSTVSTFKRPASPGRVIRVLTVVGNVHESDGNRIKRGSLLCLSFPQQHWESRDYTWKKTDPEEETQVKMNVQLHKTKGPILHDTSSPVDAPAVRIEN